MSDTTKTGVSNSTDGVSESPPSHQHTGFSPEQQAIAELMSKYPNHDPIGALDLTSDRSEPATQERPKKNEAQQASAEETESGDSFEEGEEDEFLKIFRKKGANNDHDSFEESRSLPSNIKLEDLAEQFNASPEEILSALTVKTKVQGEEAELPLKEIIKGYQSEKFATQKLQALAEKERSIEAMQQAYGDKFQQLTDELNKSFEFANAVRMHLDNEMNEINWKQLKEEDPVQYLTLERDFERKKQGLNHHLQNIAQQIQNQKARMDEEQRHHQQQYAREFQQLVATQKALLIQKRPEFKDENNLRTALKTLKTRLQEGVGLTEEQLSNPVFSNHLLVDLLLDGEMYRRMQKGDLKQKLVTKVAPKMVKQQARRGPADIKSAEADRLEEEFRQKKDANSAIKALLAQGIRL